MSATDRGSPLLWRPGDAKFRFLAAILLVLFGAYGVTYLTISLAGPSPDRFGDSFALWSWARFVVDHDATAIYEPIGLHAAQLALGMDPAISYPFGYPPSFLIVLWPIGLLPYGAACATLIVASLLLYLWATVGRDWRSPVVVAALVAPTTTLAIVAGQTGFLSAALLAGGLRLCGSCPLAAGLLFGLLTYKPQLGLLVPVALVAARLWRTLVAACATAAALALLTSALFGWGVWAAWLAVLPEFSRQFAAESGAIVHLMPTVFATASQMGLSPPIARIAQWAALLAAAALVFAAFRAAPLKTAGPALLVATFLATPYAFVYDMPMLATAILWIIAERQRSGEAFGSAEMLILVVAMIFPITLPMGTARLPLGPIVLMALLGMIAARIWCRRLPEPAAMPAE
jgi:hypothetical protein